MILDKFNKIIFDMDGVITSEHNYWDIAALAAYEMLKGGNMPKDYSVEHVRRSMFLDDRLIMLIKERGVNSNWDLTYIAFCYMSCGKSAEEVFEHIAESSMDSFEIYADCAKMYAKYSGRSLDECKRNGAVWVECREYFQQWYLGAELFPIHYGKPCKDPSKKGMHSSEIPIIPVDRLVGLLSQLTKDGKLLGVATGRPDFEMHKPLELWNITQYFDGNHLVGYTSVLDAEESFPQENLTKPNPYIFLKAILGRDYPDEKIIRGEYGKESLEGCLIVGDAGADILAAKAIGVPFVAVLTGVTGQKARGYFEEQEAEYILNDVLELIK